MSHDVVQAMVTAAQTWIGTPFHHQGRVPRVGLDCIGLIVCALRVVDVIVRDRTDYGWMPDAALLQVELTRHGFAPVDAQRAGDVLLFRFRGEPQHVALAQDSQSMIHAYAPIGRVVATGISGPWSRRLCGVYRLH